MKYVLIRDIIDICFYKLYFTLLPCPSRTIKCGWPSRSNQNKCSQSYPYYKKVASHSSSTSKLSYRIHGSPELSNVNHRVS